MYPSPPWYVTFVSSFLIYSFCRFFDERSTRRVAERLDLGKHEVNMLLMTLERRIGLDKAFKVLWIAIAAGIASADTVANTPATVAVPAVAVVFGFVHLLAAAHNYELYYNIKDKTQEEILESERRIGETLSQLNWGGRIRYVVCRNAFSFFLAAFSVSVLTWPLVAIFLWNATRSTILTTTYSYSILLAILGLLLFFPAIILGSFLVNNKLLASFKKGKIVSALSADTNGEIVVPIETVKRAISSAEAVGSMTIRFQLYDGRTIDKEKGTELDACARA